MTLNQLLSQTGLDNRINRILKSEDLSQMLRIFRETEKNRNLDAEFYDLACHNEGVSEVDLRDLRILIHESIFPDNHDQKHKEISTDMTEIIYNLYDFDYDDYNVSELFRQIRNVAVELDLQGDADKYIQRGAAPLEFASYLVKKAYLNQ